MSKFVLSTESVSDVSREYLESRDLRYVCFHYLLDDEDFIDDLGTTISYKEFYDRLRNGANPRTTQLNISEYLDYFSAICEEGYDIVHTCLSSGLSSTFNSANKAAEIARERFPERKIYIIDSLNASCGIALLVDKLADLRDEGKSAEEIYEWAEANKLRVHSWFFSSDLSFFIKNGRISRLAGAFGGVLNICPVMDVDIDGRLKVRQKVRGRKAALATVLGKFKTLSEGSKYSEKIFISSSDMPEDAAKLSEMVEAEAKNIAAPIGIYSIGPTIGSHTGPGTVAFFFWGEERKD